MRGSFANEDRLGFPSAIPMSALEAAPRPDARAPIERAAMMANASAPRNARGILRAGGKEPRGPSLRAERSNPEIVTPVRWRY
ncbi:MAG: hypothetical protein ABSC22_05410 [Roseiarcus sp.]|jgi:hypothetical protein